MLESNTKIQPLIKIFIFLTIAFSILVLKSLYLYLFLLTLLFVIFLKQQIALNQYFYIIKKIKIILTFIIVISVIAFGIFGVFKALLMLAYVLVLYFNINYEDFNEIISAILGCKRSIAVSFVTGLYFIKYFINSKEYIKKISNIYFTVPLKFKDKFISRILLANERTKNLEMIINKDFEIKDMRLTRSSKIICVCLLLFIIIVFIKEVIL